MILDCYVRFIVSVVFNFYFAWYEQILQNENSYCKFGNFCENFIFANSIQRHICDVKNSPLGHDLPSSVKDRMISLFCEGFIFEKLRASQKFPNLQYVRL